MQIPRAWIEAYSRSLNQLSDRGRVELERRLYALDWSQDVTAIREQVVAIMQTCCGASSTVAARLAADFYDGLRERSGVVDGFKAIVDPCREPEATEGAVRAFVQDLVDGKPVEQFVGKCSDRLDRETRLAANKCMEANARRDPKKPRWARVPTGPETCEFCIMLASRGFVYRSEDLASHAHANCDCRIVPSWDRGKAAVEGYDPDAYYLAWQKLAEIGRRNDLDGDEKAMLRLAVSDSLRPFSVEKARELADKMDVCIGRRANAYRAVPIENRTRELYERHIESLVSDVGDVYGMRLTGGFAEGWSGIDPTKRVESAIPNGDELWATTRMSKQFTDVHFPSIDRAIRKGNPDLLVNGEYIDIKTLHNAEKAEDRLHEGYVQCRNRGQDHGVVILSGLRLNPEDERFMRYASATVARKNRKGQPLQAYVVHGDSSTDELR